MSVEMMLKSSIVLEEFIMTIIGIVLARHVFAVHNVALNEKMFW
jgi:hypothetical protein